MAYTHFYPNVSNANLLTFMPNIPKFLTDYNAHDAGYLFPGPTTAWTVIQTYSSAAVAPFEVPADPTDLSTLAADNAWNPANGALLVGDYIVLESGSGLFQVLFEYQSTTVYNTITAPSGGFDPAAHQADPENAANWLNPRLALVAHTVNAGGIPGVTNYSIIANDTGDDFVIWSEDAVTYAIACSAKLANAFAGDANPVVTYAAPSLVYFGSGAAVSGNNWRRISAVDGTTILNLSGANLYTANGGYTTASASGLTNDATTSGSYRTLEIWLASGTAQPGHIGFQGTLPSLYQADRALFGIGTQTINAKTYGYIKNADEGGLVFPWDGVTAL